MGTSGKLVAYYRVSTDKQGRSGLGLKAQESTVEGYARATGARVIAAYSEVESGKRADRPELVRAIAHAKRSRATLVIAKLDRLARNVAFLAGLMDSGVEFLACDQPNANRLTIHILAAVAEDETRRISERTRAALQAHKARGGKLGGRRDGSHTFTTEDRARAGKIAGERHRQRAIDAYVDLVELMAKLRADGESQQTIADHLNAEGHSTRAGGPWSQVQVSRVLKRFAITEQE